jgi:hypothetical protein
MSLDEEDKNRKNFNEGFRKITKAEIDALTPKQRKIYENIVANENIAAVPKDRSRNRLINKDVRLREFDSETYVKVKQPLLNIKDKKETIMKKRRAEANKFKTDLTHPGATKGYSTELGMKVPKRNPARRPAPKENLDYRVGGMVKSIVDNRKVK